MYFVDPKIITQLQIAVHSEVRDPNQLKRWFIFFLQDEEPREER